MFASRRAIVTVTTCAARAPVKSPALLSSSQLFSGEVAVPRASSPHARRRSPLVDVEALHAAVCVRIAVACPVEQALMPYFERRPRAASMSSSRIGPYPYSRETRRRGRASPAAAAAALPPCRLFDGKVRSVRGITDAEIAARGFPSARIQPRCGLDGD